ncbi:hypothetical protein ACLBWX_08065 [Methylobacterium sp. M6A4_1b]
MTETGASQNSVFAEAEACVTGSSIEFHIRSDLSDLSINEDDPDDGEGEVYAVRKRCRTTARSARVLSREMAVDLVDHGTVQPFQ